MIRLFPLFGSIWVLAAAWIPSASATDGISLDAVYTAEALANVRGGVREDGEFLGNVDLQLSADLHALLDWRDAELFVYGLGNHGGGPSEDVGDLQGVSNIEAPETWKLYEAWIEQRLAGDRLSVRAGLYDLNSEFDVIPVAALFLQSSFGIGPEFSLSGPNGPSIFPTTSLGARLDIRLGTSTYARATALDGVPGDRDDPRGTQIILRRSVVFCSRSSGAASNRRRLRRANRTRLPSESGDTRPNSRTSIASIPRATRREKRVAGASMLWRSEASGEASPRKVRKSLAFSGPASPTIASSPSMGTWEQAW